MDKCIKVSVPTGSGWRECLYRANEHGTYEPASDEYKMLSHGLLLWHCGVDNTVEDECRFPYQVIAQYGDEFPV